MTSASKVLPLVWTECPSRYNENHGKPIFPQVPRFLGGTSKPDSYSLPKASRIYRTYIQGKVHEAGSILASLYRLNCRCPTCETNVSYIKDLPAPEQLLPQKSVFLPYLHDSCTQLLHTSPPVPSLTVSLPLSLCFPFSRFLLHTLSLDPVCRSFSVGYAHRDSHLLRLPARGTRVLESRKFYYCPGVSLYGHKIQKILLVCARRSTVDDFVNAFTRATI